MQYINKSISKFKVQAHRLLSIFIQGQWQQDANSYVNLTYESFRNDDIRDILLKEQSHYCCYCMKHILGKETTLEHVIPNKAKGPTLISKYISYGEIRYNVFFWESNMRFTKLQMPPFPHILSYENLVASCNGSILNHGLGKCCNNVRKSKDIIPFFYINNK
ncbi:hypothetical protein EZS27_013636 [termite gut metagenome]|uniref:HNH nuclease domain-containing protein n=1 Tax=termite gut metagenome TaxID=433724 RepID=A0A5J4RXM9_9ZZZZ